MRVLITGASGFIGKNLVVRLRELKSVEVSTFDRVGGLNQLSDLVRDSDSVIHLGGVNRTNVPDEFYEGNAGFTSLLCEAVAASGKCVPIVYSSSVQVDVDSDYGRSKLSAEEALKVLNKDTGCPIYIYRLPNIFGKWAKPNYNSVVATFCHNIARDLPININNPNTQINLVYIDDLIDSFLEVICRGNKGDVGYESVTPEYQLTVGKLADIIMSFGASRDNLTLSSVGVGVTRAMYATYLSYLPENKFVYRLRKNADPRGMFVELLKTENCGQFSYFTALPGATRGGHYHHTKAEKFFVLRGEAVFRFYHCITGEKFEVGVTGGEAQVVETVPGWTHNITNVGETELICLLWANEIYDPKKPDTHACLMPSFV